MSEKYECRLGIAGYGLRGKHMYDLALKAGKNIIPAALCDISEAVLDEAKMKYPQAMLFGDYKKMLEEANLDAILIETPADNHAVFCGLALDAGINVLSDIPPVRTLPEANMLWQAASKSKAIFMTGANPNFWGFVETAKELLVKGLIGKPYYLEAEYIHDVQYLYELTPWRKTGRPIKYCTHSLGPLLTLIDEDLRYVSCFSTGSHMNNYPGQTDLMTAHFRTESNIVLRLTTSFINHAPVGHYYRIFGTKGYFERFPGRNDLIKPFTTFASSEISGSKPSTVLPVDYGCPEYKDNPDAVGHGGADYAMLDKFFKALREKNPSPLSLREGLRMTLPGIFANESADKGGEVVRIKYPWDVDFGI